MSFEQKYLKYKNKYFILKKSIGGAGNCDKQGILVSNETYIKKGCKITELKSLNSNPQNDQDRKTNESNKKINKDIYNL